MSKEMVNVTIRCTKEEREEMKKLVHISGFYDERTIKTIIRVLKKDNELKLVNDKDFIFKG